MSKSAIITARVNPETLAMVDAVAKSHGRSRAWFAAEAIRRVAESEADFLGFVQEGIDAANRGELIPHEEVRAEFEARIANHRARCEG